MPREHERVALLKETTVESLSGKRQVRITDLSVGGCYIDSIAANDVGEDVVLQLTHDSGTLKLRGHVAYVLAGNGFGVEFVDLTDNDKEIIESLMGSGSQ